MPSSKTKKGNAAWQQRQGPIAQKTNRNPNCMTRGPPILLRILPKSVVSCKSLPGVAKLTLLKGIEHIPTELHAHVLLDTGVLGQAEVETLLKVVSKNVASQVAKTAEWRSQNTCIEKLLPEGISADRQVPGAARRTELTECDIDVKPA